ncbi:MAG: DUF1857 family protein, partial [Nostoc sp. C3-bin3]|nr:DUF1857 family protein [Nostoc sp. C3-bin3]
YDGKMTLAGQCSSNVADLIVKVGATNQLKKDTVDLTNRQQNIKSGLGGYLQGVQHVGVTVSDMAKSLEFYTEVLGGKLVIAEDGLVGDRMQNTLFQKEELDAIAQGIDLNNLDIPNLKDAKDALDIQFISFGNACIELIYFRDAARSNKENSSVGSIPSHIGHVNAMHISFHIKEDLDLNVFAQMLEAECQKRGLTNVVCNRVIRVKSEAERKQVALKYNSAKFWNEPELLAEGEPETDFGEFEGWALFYCKGPNGEQLEFNQATRKVKTHFEQAREKYNMANQTFFSDSKLSASNSIQLGDKSERIHATFSSPINASLSTVWQVLLDKIENPRRYNLEAQNYRILERHPNQVLREMKVLNMTIEEIITWNEATKEIRHTLVNNSLFIGQAVNAVILPASHDPNAQPIITFSLDWEPYNEEGRQVVPEIRAKIVQALEQAVLNSKTIAELQAESPSAITNGKTAAIKNGSKPSIETLPGKTTDMVKRLFSRGEAFDTEGFLTFFTDTPLYQFGNFPVCLDKAAIKQSAEAFFSRISAVYHDIKMMWEIGDVVFVEMDVTYWRKDGSVITLPCFDIFRVEGDKFSELRIFMDVNPVFDPTISVPDNASVFTMSKGNILDSPNIMKKHFAEHPEGIKRIETGFAPKWSINGDHSFNSQITKSASKVDLVMEMEAAGGNHDWEYFKTFFVDDVYFKVGSSQEKRGYQAIRDYLIWLYKVAEPKLPFEFRGTWEIGDVVIIEMNAKYTRRSDGKLMIFPCTDILRFESNKIREWRVYPDQSELWMTEKVKFHGPRTYR